MNREISLAEPGKNPGYFETANKVAANLQSAENFIDSAPAGAFIAAMRGAVTGVNIVTTDGSAGRFGVTVSAFSSVSAEPPIVLVCIHQKSPVAAAITENRCFDVNVLSIRQQHLAGIFAGYPEDGVPYDFSAASWDEPATGAPTLSKAIAGFDCVLATSITAGSHRIFIGRVVAVTGRPGQPLLYTNREYGRCCR